MQVTNMACLPLDDNWGNRCMLKHPQHSRRMLAVRRFQPSQHETGAIPIRLQQTSTSAERASDSHPAVSLPAAQEMQASVMLVPKETATQNILKHASAAGSPLNSFLVKCRLAWNLFFPPQDQGGSTRQLSPKELGKQRLSMILVADRCGLSPNSLVEMKRSTLAALQDCMDLEDLHDAHLRFTMTRENGVTYSMAVPILRPDPYAEEAAHEADGDDDDVLDAAMSSVGASGSWDEVQESEQYNGSHASLDEQEPHPGVDSPDATAWSARQSPAPAMGASRPASADSFSSRREGMEAADVLAEAAGGPGQHAPVQAPSPVPAAAATATPWGSRSSSRAASRGVSPIEIPLDGTAVMTPDMLKELLVEELVHDVEELVEHMGPKAGVRAVETEAGVLVISAEAALGAGSQAAAAAAADELAGHLEAAVAEVQHFGEPVAEPGTATGQHQPGHKADTQP